MSKQSFKPRTDPEKCRRGCGMMVYLDFVRPEGKTESGKYRPLVYYPDTNEFSGQPHDCPKSEYNQKKLQQGQSTSTEVPVASVAAAAKPRPTADAQQAELYKHLGDMVTAISQRLDQINARIDAIEKQVTTVAKYVMNNEALAQAEQEYDQDKEDGIDYK